MMLLVVLGVAFMWIVQLFILEQRIIDSTATETLDKLQPVISRLETENLYDNEELMLSLSKAANGKMIVFDRDSNLISVYSSGYRLDRESIESLEPLLNYLKNSEEYQHLIIGVAYNKVLRHGPDPIALEMGVPIHYGDTRASIILYQSLDQLHALLTLNRNQLIILSIALTLIAAFVAILLSRRFVKPVWVLKETVDKLAEGDLAATPGLTLKDELGQLSDSVEELGQALQRVEVLRKEVIANVSHELRAPLALISGYAEMVRDISWQDEEKRNEDLDLIIRESNRMSEMVNDILDYSQLQAGYIQVNREMYNLIEIIESEVLHSKPGADEYKISIAIDSYSNDIPVNVDAVKICQVMRNLLNNAVNHTADGETIRIVITKADEIIRVAVINPGEPIPDEDLEIIWEKYQRSQHVGRRNSGTGIGLSIVSTFLKAHDMPYGVKCADGFTTFWFEYPERK